jgi:hypothetical protein
VYEALKPCGDCLTLERYILVYYYLFKLLVYEALSLTLERYILVYYYLFKLLVYEA